MSSGKKSDSNFLVQGSILAIASIVSRIIGLLYRIPMTNIIGDTGNSYYSAAFEIYNILLNRKNFCSGHAVLPSRLERGISASLCLIYVNESTTSLEG